MIRADPFSLGSNIVNSNRRHGCGRVLSPAASVATESAGGRAVHALYRWV